MFLSVAPKKMFDLVFLDIYMEDINGVDTAKELRCFNADCLLVFITSSMEHALDAFRVRAFHYLVKPYKDEELTKLFDEIIHRFPVQDRYIEVKASGSIVRLRFQDILYAEHYQHQIHIYQTNNQKTVTRQTFREFSARLADGHFFSCSRGLIVNLEHVKDFDGTSFILMDGKILPVSRDLAKAARMAFGDFLFDRRTDT